MPEISIVWDDESRADPEEIRLPAVWAICRTCGGDGHHSRHLGAFTREDMDEQGPEFMEDYIAGHYDKTCETCNGSGKVKRANEAAMTPAQLKLWRDHQRGEAEDRAAERSERFMYGPNDWGV